MDFRIEIRDRVAVVWIEGTPANSQGEEFYLMLHRALDRLDGEFAGCGAVLTASGPTFSAGLDLPYVAKLFADGDADAQRAWLLRYLETNLRLFSFERPLVAAINGHAYAGGLITALCADYRIAAEGKARFALNEVPIGIPMPTTYLELIAHAVGWPAAARLSLFGEELDVAGAKEAGFLDEVVPPGEVLERAISFVRRIPAESLPAFTTTKRGLRAPVLGRMRAAAYATDAGLPGVLAGTSSRQALAARLNQVGLTD